MIQSDVRTIHLTRLLMPSFVGDRGGAGAIQ